MEQKNRLMFSLAVIFLIFTALLISFGRSLFRLETPDVVLPDVNAPVSDEAPGSSGSNTGSSQTVSVTPKTVQNVIATLERSDSFYREMTLEQFWSTGSSRTTVQVWTDQDWTHTRQLMPNGLSRHDMVGPDTAYLWYDGSSRYESLPADLYSTDLAQRLPTYETVLSLPQDSITDAGYEVLDSSPCIYTKVSDPQRDRSQCFWVSVDSGLLVRAELWQGDTLLYRSSALTPVQSPCPEDALFSLPDGTVLHTP